MKKLLPVLILLGACTPDIAEEAPPGPAIVVLFDPVAACPPPGAPPLVPKPNDLAIDPVTKKIVVPPCATDSPAEKELNEKYLGSLEAFPFESTATVGVSGDLKPESVNPKNVLAFDVTATPVPVATNVRGRSPALRRKSPWGRCITVSSPDFKPRTYREPGPPELVCTMKTSLPASQATMEYSRHSSSATRSLMY